MSPPSRGLSGSRGDPAALPRCPAVHGRGHGRVQELFLTLPQALQERRMLLGWAQH